MRSNLLATAIVASLGLTGLAFSGSASAQQVSAEQLQQLQAQVAQLQAQIDALQAQADAQSDVNVAQAKAVESTADTQKAVEKLAKLVNDTTVSGKIFLDTTHIDQESNGSKTASTGTGFDLKRFYVGIDHKFNDVWSAAITTDFQYTSLDSAANLYIKKAYVQGKFSDAFVFRAGASDMPWIPYAEKFYGFRYVENTLTDRLKFGTSSDWGLHAAGDLGGGVANYDVAVVNGAGYKSPTRGKGMDIEARVGFVPVENMVIAVGGYSGKLGKETETVDGQHTATRGDVMVAYASKAFRLGGEYFQAKNWTTVLSPTADKADGWSVWGSVPLTETGITAFARYDKANTSKDIDPSLQNKYFNLGVEFPITKGIKLAAVYKDTKNENDTSIDLHTKEFGVWGEVGF